VGHIRLGRHPRRGHWVAVFDAFTDQAANPLAIANATARASAERFEGLGRDPTVNYCLWTPIWSTSAALLARVRTSEEPRA